jgi:hypothetical protein
MATVAPRTPASTPAAAPARPARAPAPPARSRPPVVRAAAPARSSSRPPVVRAALGGPPAVRLSSAVAPPQAGSAIQPLGADLGQSAPPALRLGGGEPMDTDVRASVEESLGADMGSVRIHSGGAAARAAQTLSARAFAFGPNIVLGPGERASDLAVIGHEATHVVQQRGAPVIQRLAAGQSDPLEREAHAASAAIQRGEPFAVQGRTGGERVQRLGLSDALNFFADKANLIPGFRMFTIILGVNPINMSRVDRSAANIMRAIIEFLPGGGLITMALDAYGVFDKVGNWVEQQIATLGMTGSMIKDAISKFLDSLSWSDIFNLGSVWERAKRIFTEPIDRIISFGKGLVTGILKFIKDAILMPLAKLAEGTKGWDLLIAVLGTNPITGETVPRNADTLVGGFMKLIGQEEIWANVKKANAIARVWAWFQSALATLLAFVAQIPTLAVNAFKALELADIVLLPRAFAKVAAVFGNFIGSFISWAGNAVWNLLQIIFEVVAPAVMPYIKKAAAAFKTILKDPIGFVGNLVRAGKLGFEMFAKNFLTHLKTALIKWLTGPLGEAGVYIPKSFDLIEIVKLVLSVLGLTWQNIRTKLLKIIPEPVLVLLEKTAGVLVTLVKDGPAAAWQQIKAELSELKDQMIAQVTQMVTTEVVKAAVVKLVSMINPAGALVQAILAIYNTVTFFIEKINQIAAVVASFIDSISAIASGQVEGAAKKVEQTMANTLTVVIAFLAKFAGLGNIPAKLVGVVKKIREPIDRGLDKIVAWLGKMLEKAKDALAGKKDGVTQKAFSLPKEGHTVTAKATDGKLRVTIASDRESDILTMLTDAIAEVRANKTKDEKQKSEIIRDLDGARQTIKSMDQDWKAAPNQKQDFAMWAEIRLSQIVNLLSKLGADGIKAFQDFKGKVLAKRYLPPEYDVRAKLYIRGSNWTANQSSVTDKGKAAVEKDVKEVINNRTTNPTVANNAWNRLVKDLCVPDNATQATLTLQHLKNTKYDVDHMDVLSIHWESGGGNNTKDGERWKLSEPAKLRYITKRDNLARPKGIYIAWVGKEFTSQYAQAGQDNAKTIDDKPFLDAPGGNPI